MKNNELNDLGIPDPTFQSNNIFSSQPLKPEDTNVIIAEANPYQIEFEFNSQDDDKADPLEKEYETFMADFHSDLPDDRRLKHWADNILCNSYSENALHKVLFTRDYDSLKSLQATLGIKSGYLIMLINWIKDGNIKRASDNEKLDLKYREPVGKYPRIEYHDSKNASPAEKAQRLCEDLQKDIGKELILKDQQDIKRFIDHLEYIYRISFTKKFNINYLGLFVFTCGMKKNFQDCPFELKFTRYNDANYPILVKKNLLHCHDPWEKNPPPVPRGPRTEIVKPEITRSESSIIEVEETSHSRTVRLEDLSPAPRTPLRSRHSRKRRRSEHSLRSHKHKGHSRSHKRKYVEKQQIVIELEDDSDGNGHQVEYASQGSRESRPEILINDSSTFKSVSRRDSIRVKGDMNNFRGEGDQLLVKNDNPSHKITSSNENDELTFDTSYQMEAIITKDSVRTKIDSQICKDITNLLIEYVPGEEVKIPESIASEIQFKSICGIDQETIEDDAINEIYDTKDPTYEQQFRCRHAMQNCVKDSTKKLKVLYEFMTLQELLDKNHRKTQKSYMVSSKDSEECLGMYIDLKRNKSPDLIPKAFFIDTQCKIEIAYETKSVFVYQIDRFEEFVLKAIFLFKKYEETLITQFLCQLKEINGGIDEISVNLDETFISAIKLYNAENKVNYYICEKHLTENTQKIIMITNYIKAMADRMEDTQEQKVKKRKDQAELHGIVHKISSKLDLLWNKYEKQLKYSKIFSKRVISKYQTWCDEHKELLNKDFSEVLPTLIEPLPINKKNLDEAIWSLLGFNPKCVIKTFVKDADNKEDEVNLTQDEEILSYICKTYTPPVAHKIFMNYLMGKMCSVEIPSIESEEAKIPLIIIKEPHFEKEAKEGTERIVPDIKNFKKFIVHPQTLVCNCPEFRPKKVACMHKMAYIFQGVQLPIQPIISNNLLIPEKFKIKKTSRLKLLFSKILAGLEDKKMAEEKSSLFEMSKIVKEFQGAQAKAKIELQNKLKYEKKEQIEQGPIVEVPREKDKKMIEITIEDESEPNSLIPPLSNTSSEFITAFDGFAKKEYNFRKRDEKKVIKIVEEAI